MKTPVLFAAVLALMCAIRCFGSDPAGGKNSAKDVVAPPAVDLIDPVLGLGGKTNDQFTEMSAFLTLPLWSTIGAGDRIGGSLLFAEPYGTWGEEGELGASLGLGFRHLFSDQSVHDALSATEPGGLLTEGVYVGGNVFLDTVNTINDNQLWQLGAGIEAGTRYIRVRANYYAPLGNPQGVGRFDAIELRNPRVSGTSVVADATTRTFELQETPAEGWDVEMALLVPYIDRHVDLQLIGGYSSFDVGGSERFEGWRAGVEFRPVPAIALSATWYEREEYRQGDWLLGVRFEIPLGARMKDAFKFRRRHTYERMMEPVARQNVAILTGRTA